MPSNGGKHGDALADKMRDQFRRNRAARERALRASATERRRSSPSLADADFEETTEQRLMRLEAARVDSKPPGAVGWLTKRFLEFTSGMPWYGKIAALAIVLGALLKGGLELCQALGWVK